MAYVFQDSVLFTDTIENNIRMGNTAATMAEVEQAAKNAGIHEVIQALPKGYQTVVGRDNAYLSRRREAAPCHRPGLSEGRAHCHSGRGNRLRRR